MLSMFVCFFGLMISNRLFSALFSRFHLEKKVPRSFFCGILIFDLVVIAAGVGAFGAWLCQIFLFVLVWAAPHVIERRLEFKLKTETVNFLDQVVLSVQSGDSLRNSIRSVSDREKSWKRFELQRAYTQFILAEKPAPLRSAALQALFEELRFIDQGRVRTLEQLKSLRWHYKVQEDFRRRSIQVTQQTRIQTFVVTLLYLALLAFNIFHFGFFENIKLVLFSMTFFVAGVCLVFILGRRVKWKI